MAQQSMKIRVSVEGVRASVAGVNRISRSMRGVGVATRGVTLATAGLAMAYGGLIMFARKSVRAGRELEGVLARTAAIAGVEGQAFVELRDRAMRLGETTEYTARQVAIVQQSLASAGVAAQDLGAALGPAMNLATVYGAELTDSADIMATAVAAFGMSEESAAKKGKTLNEELSRTATLAGVGLRYSLERSLPALMSGFGKAAGAAAKFKWDIKEAFVGISAFNLATARGAHAGYAMEGFLSRLAKLADGSGRGMKRWGKLLREQLSKVGMTMEQLDPAKVGNMADLMANVAKAIEGMPVGRIEAIFGRQAGRYLGIFSQQLKSGRINIKKISEEMGKVDPKKLANMAVEMRKSSFMQYMIGVTSKLEALGHAFYEVAQPSLTEAYKEFGVAIGEVIDYFKSGAGMEAVRGFVESVKSAAVWMVKLLPKVADFVATHPQLVKWGAVFMGLRMTGLLRDIGGLTMGLTSANAQVLGLSTGLRGLEGIKGALTVAVAIGSFKVGKWIAEKAELYDVEVHPIRPEERAAPAAMAAKGISAEEMARWKKYPGALKAYLSTLERFGAAGGGGLGAIMERAGEATGWEGLRKAGTTFRAGAAARMARLELLERGIPSEGGGIAGGRARTSAIEQHREHAERVAKDREARARMAEERFQEVGRKIDVLTRHSADEYLRQAEEDELSRRFGTPTTTRMHEPVFPEMLMSEGLPGYEDIMGRAGDPSGVQGVPVSITVLDKTSNGIRTEDVRDGSDVAGSNNGIR